MLDYDTLYNDDEDHFVDISAPYEHPTEAKVRETAPPGSFVKRELGKRRGEEERKPSGCGKGGRKARWSG